METKRVLQTYKPVRAPIYLLSNLCDIWEMTEVQNHNFICPDYTSNITPQPLPVRANTARIWFIREEGEKQARLFGFCGKHCT